MSPSAEGPQALHFIFESAYDRALGLSPDYVVGHIVKGNTLYERYLNLCKMNQYSEALQSLNQAVESYDEALRRIPDSAERNKIYCIKRKALALFEAVHLSGEIDLPDAASLALQKALDAFYVYLQYFPDDISMQEKLSRLTSFSESRPA